MLAMARIFGRQLYAESLLGPAVFVAVPVFILMVVTASIHLPAAPSASTRSTRCALNKPGALCRESSAS
ncbi:MAG: hypothetical protein ABI273_00045 [Lacunisphaera sp.]